MRGIAILIATLALILATTTLVIALDSVTAKERADEAIAHYAVCTRQISSLSIDIFVPNTISMNPQMGYLVINIHPLSDRPSDIERARKVASLIFSDLQNFSVNTHAGPGINYAPTDHGYLHMHLANGTILIDELPGLNS